MRSLDAIFQQTRHVVAVAVVIGYARQVEEWWVVALWSGVLAIDAVMLALSWLRMRREEREEREKEVIP